MSKILDYNKICEAVKKVDSKIRFAGVINPRGIIVAGGMKDKLEPLESKNDVFSGVIVELSKDFFH